MSRLCSRCKTPGHTKRNCPDNWPELKISLSEEQKEVLELCDQGFNIIVTGSAGCGKTVTILALAEAFPEKSFLVTQYNSRLKEEVREKVKRKGLKNIEVHSHHGLATSIYTINCSTDEGLREILENNLPPKRPRTYDVLIVDECQDLCPLLYKILRKEIEDLRWNDIQLVFLGDEHQVLYSFLGADSRFLTYADRLFPSSRPWSRTILQTTYRCSKTICDFVNGCLLHENKLKPRDNEFTIPVEYFYGTQDQSYSFLVSRVRELLNSGYQCEDIFVLAQKVYSDNSQYPLSILGNLFSRQEGWKLLVPHEDSGPIKMSQTVDRIVFSTIAAAKGLERKVVIMMGFDESLFQFFKTSDDREVLPPDVYVATTRAKERLIVVHDSSFSPYRFFQVPEDDRIVVVTPERPWSEVLIHRDTILRSKSLKKSVTALVKFLSSEVIEEALSLLDLTFLEEPSYSLSLPTTTEGGKEDVSDLNGIALPSLMEYHWVGSMTIERMNISSLPPDLRRRVSSISERTIEQVLELSNFYLACQTGWLHRLKQITSYNWLSDEVSSQAMAELEKRIGRRSVFEKPLSKQIELKGLVYEINGRIDVYDRDTSALWELKCTKELEASHILQTALYAWLDDCESRYLLFHIPTGKTIEIKSDMERLRRLVLLLLDQRRGEERMDDSEFFASLE